MLFLAKSYRENDTFFGNDRDTILVNCGSIRLRRDPFRLADDAGWNIGRKLKPLSENDLLRERVGTNIGQASDQQLSSLAFTQRIVVSVPAGCEIYVVLEKVAKESPQTRSQPSTELAGQPSIEELRQLLRLQREMNATSPAPHE